MKIYNHKTGESFFSKRRRRHDKAGQARELTFSCYRRYKFLNRDRSRLWFIDALETAREEWPFDLWAYALMPEHVHLLVYPRKPKMKLGTIVGEIKGKVGRKGIRYLIEHAPHWLPRVTVQEGKRSRRRFWQPGGGYDRNVVELSTVHQMIDYIHANPVRRGLVSRPEDWEWSSARWYAGIRPVPVELDRTIPTFHYSN